MALHNVCKSDTYDLVKYVENDITLLNEQVKQKSVPLEDSMEAWIIVKLNSKDVSARLDEIKSGEEEETAEADTELVRKLSTMKILNNRLQKVEAKIFRLSRLNDLKEKVWFIVFWTACLVVTFLMLASAFLQLLGNPGELAPWIGTALTLGLFWALARMHPWTAPLSLYIRRWTTALYERCRGTAVSTYSQEEPLLQDHETEYQEPKLFKLWRHNLPTFQPTP